MNATLQRLIVAFWGLVFALGVPSVARAQEQQRAVAEDVESCRAFASPNVEVPLSGPVDIQKILGWIWNGGSASQGVAYFDSGSLFPAPVLTHGLPVSGSQFYTDIGPLNWLRPGTDNAFSCAFRREAPAAECGSSATTTPAPAPQFTTFIDLLRANPIGRFVASVTVTERFVHLNTQVLRPLRNPATQTRRPDPNQVGVPAGSTRWIYTASATLTPDCEGRPVDAHGNPVPLAINGVPTLLGRAYFTRTCVPRDPESMNTIYRWNPTRQYEGSRLSVQFKVRAVPLIGHREIPLVVPRSSGFQSVSERACLALAHRAELATANDPNVCLERTQLTAWNRELVPATHRGVVAEDLRQAATAASDQIDQLLAQATCSDARLMREKEAARRNAVIAQGQAEDRARKSDAKAAKHWLWNKIQLAVISAFVAFTIFLLVRLSKVRKQSATNLKQSSDSSMAYTTNVHAFAAYKSQIVDSLDALLASARGVLHRLSDVPMVFRLRKDAEELADNPAFSSEPALQLRYIHIAMQCGEMDLSTVLSKSDPGGAKGGLSAEEPDRVTFTEVGSAKALKSFSELRTSTPPGGTSQGGSAALYAFVATVLDFLFAEGRAEPEMVKRMAAKLAALKVSPPDVVLEEITTVTVAHLTDQHEELTLRRRVMGGLGPYLTKFAGLHQQSWNRVQLVCGTAGDVLLKPMEFSLDGGLDAVIARRSSDVRSGRSSRAGSPRGSIPPTR